MHLNPAFGWTDEAAMLAFADQVPTWHYEAVELRGTARRLDDAGLLAQVAALSAAMEAIHQPDRPWTLAKTDPAVVDAMLKAIVGFEVELESISGVRKFNQHKKADERAATIAGQAQAGRADIVAAIRELTGVDG